MSQHLQVSYSSEPSTPAPLLRPVPTCAYCDRPLSGGRRYLCQVCQPAPLRTSAADYDWTGGREEAHNQADCKSPQLDRPQLDQAGRLRIPLSAPAVYRWWQGGQSPADTARELGATEAEIARLQPPRTRLRKVEQ